MSTKKNRKIKEELGRNKFTPNTNPYQYWEVSGVSVDLYPQEGQYAVQIEVESDSSLSSPLRLFSSEELDENQEV